MARFEKGNPGGPGRPKKTEEQIKFERRCREFAETLGIDRLIYWAKHSNPTASLAALQEINNRGFGKSVAFEVVDANLTSEPSSSPDELARKIAELGGEGKNGSGQAAGPVGMEPGK